MATITLKGISPRLHRALKQRAARNRRSLNSEILVILENYYGIPAGPSRSAESIRREAEKFRNSLGFTTTPEEIDAAKRAGRE
jgi:antitoxin FitA